MSYDVEEETDYADMFISGEDMTRAISPHLFGESEATERLKSEMIKYSLEDSYRVRMNGSSAMMWNVFVALGLVGITWMMLQ